MKQNSEKSKFGDEQRLIPRFPVPKEKIKFLFETGDRIFAIRDLSNKGIAISLLEPGESLYFREGEICSSEIRLGEESFPAALRVARVSAWSVGFTFEELAEANIQIIHSFLNPMHIGSSLRKVDLSASPDSSFQNISSWYHGAASSDLYFWTNHRAGIERALLLLGKTYWEWSENDGVQTGIVDNQDTQRTTLQRDHTPNPRVCGLVRKVLEHAEVLDYRLVCFLKEKT